MSSYGLNAGMETPVPLNGIVNYALLNTSPNINQTLPQWPASYYGPSLRGGGIIMLVSSAYYKHTANTNTGLIQLMGWPSTVMCARRHYPTKANSAIPIRRHSRPNSAVRCRHQQVVHHQWQATLWEQPTSKFIYVICVASCPRVASSRPIARTDDVWIHQQIIRDAVQRQNVWMFVYMRSRRRRRN